MPGNAPLILSAALTAELIVPAAHAAEVDYVTGARGGVENVLKENDEDGHGTQGNPFLLPGASQARPSLYTLALKGLSQTAMEAGGVTSVPSELPAETDRPPAYTSWLFAGFADVNATRTPLTLPNYTPTLNQGVVGLFRLPKEGEVSWHGAVAIQGGQNIDDLSPPLVEGDAFRRQVDGVIRHLPLAHLGVSFPHSQWSLGIKPLPLGPAGVFTVDNSFNQVSLHQLSLPNYALGLHGEWEVKERHALRTGLYNGWNIVGAMDQVPIGLVSHEYKTPRWSWQHSVLGGPVGRDLHPAWRAVGESKVGFNDERFNGAAFVNLGMEGGGGEKRSHSWYQWGVAGIEGVFRPFEDDTRFLTGARFQRVIDPHGIVMPQPGHYDAWTVAGSFRPLHTLRLQLEYNGRSHSVGPPEHFVTFSVIVDFRSRLRGVL